MWTIAVASLCDCTILYLLVLCLVIHVALAYAPQLSSLHRTSLSFAHVLLQLRTLAVLLALVYVCIDIDGLQYPGCMG